MFQKTKGGKANSECSDCKCIGNAPRMTRVLNTRFDRTTFSHFNYHAKEVSCVACVTHRDLILSLWDCVNYMVHGHKSKR